MKATVIVGGAFVSAMLMAVLVCANGSAVSAHRDASLLPGTKQVRTDGSAASFISPKIREPGGAYIFVSFGGVYIYNVRGEHVGTLTGSSHGGLAVDKAGSLYVADAVNKRIAVYAPPYNTQPATLPDPDFPSAVAVDARGNVAAINGSGTVTLYAKGAATGPKVVSGQNFSELSYGAFDASGNLYVLGVDSNHTTGIIGIVMGGVKGTTISGIGVDDGLEFPAGVQVERNGLVAIQADGDLLTFSPDKNFDLGQPVSRIPLTNEYVPVAFAFTSSNAGFVSVGAPQSRVGGAHYYTYPQGKAIKSFSFPLDTTPYGVAINPAEIP